jgi:hypothetical protein
MRTVFYTIISDSHYHGCRTDDFIKSFKKFHPDIDLVVFRQKEIDETFGSNPKLNFYNSKASFAKKLYNDYDLVVNIDADHLIFDRLDEILIGDYDVAAPANYNCWLNTGIGTNTFGNNDIFSRGELVSHVNYLQGGLIASTSRKFWDEYEYMCLKASTLFGNKENDILNLIHLLLPYNFKVLDGDYDYRSENFKCYYGCASLGRENQVKLENDKLILDNKVMKAYHFARAGIEKIHPRQLFSSQVCDFIDSQILV